MSILFLILAAIFATVIVLALRTDAVRREDRVAAAETLMVLGMFVMLMIAVFGSQSVACY